MNQGVERYRTGVYMSLFTIQVFGAGFIVLEGLPAFRQLALNPGEQPPYTSYENTKVLAVLLAMQAAYWYRILRVEIPFRGPSSALSHLFSFLGRLNFIFGSTVFSIALFRHLPELGPGADIALVVRRGIVLVVSLFALFCATLELERLGTALAEKNRA